jgi:DNA-binding transcriptional ArsR family regulator
MKCSPYHVFFRNLGNPLRIQIVTALKDKPSSVNVLSKNLKVEQSKLSHALALLRSCNLVNCEQKGKQRIYSLNKKTMVPILDLLDKHAREFCNNDKCSCLDEKSQSKKK